MRCSQWQKCEPKAGGSLFLYNLCIGGSLYGSLVGADGSVSVPAGSEIREIPLTSVPGCSYPPQHNYSVVGPLEASSAPSGEASSCAVGRHRPTQVDLNPNVAYGGRKDRWTPNLEHPWILSSCPNNRRDGCPWRGLTLLRHFHEPRAEVGKDVWRFNRTGKLTAWRLNFFEVFLSLKKDDIILVVAHAY